MADEQTPERIWLLLHEGDEGEHVWCDDPDPDGRGDVEAVEYLRASGWQPIATAPTDGTLVWVYAAPREGLDGFVTHAAYHPDGGWCVCEIRHAEFWQPMVKPEPPQ